MNDRERALVDYACILCLYGEDSKQEREFTEKYAIDQSLQGVSFYGSLMEVVLRYRALKGQ